MKSILIRALSYIKEVAYVLGLWSPTHSKELLDSISNFITVNKPYWPECSCSKKGVLVEGHLSAYGPNYLVRTAIAARAIQEKTGLDIEVVFNGFSHQWDYSKNVYQSFGIHKWIYLSSHYILVNFVLYFFSRVLAVWYKLSLKNPEDILKITFNSIKVGDLIYDDVLRETKSNTIDCIDSKVTKCISKSLYFYFQYKLLFYRRSYSYYISTHTAYSEYGLLCRVALMYDIKVIETSDIQMSLYSEISNNNLPTYHDGIKNSILDVFDNSQVDLDRLCLEAKESLHQRLDSKISQIDAQKAYRGKVYTKKELKHALGIRNEKKIAFVLAHIFKDAPHLSSSMLHADYYQWLFTTLEICSRSTDLNWVVKPHPSSILYDECGLIEKMVDKLNSANVFICPDDLNTKSLSVCADTLITVHGTAGLEYSCLGIPVVLAGKPFYSEFGFTIEPDSKANYEKALLNLNNVTALTDKQINKALEVYAIWNEQFDWHNPIITSEVQANVWGSDIPRDLEEAYRLLTENLLVNDPRKLKLWLFAQDAVK
jgi:hypothetical protein